MKQIGILALVGQESGGMYQYAQSIIDALAQDSTNKYIIFCHKNDNRFDNYNLEIRKIDKINDNVFVKFIRLFQLLYLNRKAYTISTQEQVLYADIDLFVVPFISSYPHFFINKPFVFTLHDMQEKYFPNFFTKYQLFYRWVTNRALSKFANKIICESSFVKNDIVQFTGTSSQKIEIIQSPPPLEFLDFCFDEIEFDKVQKKYNLPKKYIFYPAQCWHHKNHIKLIEAFYIVSKKFNDVYLILTGSQNDNYTNVVDKISEISLDDRVKHLGYIDYEDLPYFYKMSQFLIMPTLFESVSIPIYEAFSLEVAVCSSNVVALPEQVGEAGLIFDPNNSEDMAEKIMLYLNDGELRQKKAKLGLEKVLNFNHQGHKKKLLKVLKND